MLLVIRNSVVVLLLIAIRVIAVFAVNILSCIADLCQRLPAIGIHFNLHSVKHSHLVLLLPCLLLSRLLLLPQSVRTNPTRLSFAVFGPRKAKKLIVGCGRTISELLHSLSPLASSSDCHFLRCGCRDSRHVCASESSRRLPCVLDAALLRLIHPFRSFHFRLSLQSWFIPSLSDSNLDPLVASFQPKNGRSSKSCRSSRAIESSSPPVHSLTVHLILRHPGWSEEY